MKRFIASLILSSFASLPLLAASSALRSHIVAKGDTLSGIARKNGCTVADLKKANGLTTDIIRIGQPLLLPKADADAPQKPVSESETKPVKKPASPDEKSAKPGAKAETKDAASPVSPIERALKALPESDRWKVHIFLDRARFAPGKVDGLIGEFTVKAAERWIAAKSGRDVKALIDSARTAVGETKVTHTIPESAAKFVGEVPAKLEEKAAAKTLPYESLAEFVAERYHTDLSTLRRLNAGIGLESLRIGDSLQVPAVTPFTIESWSAKGAPKAEAQAITLRIDHQQRMIELRNAAGALTAAFPITVGTKPEHVRTGTWQIRSITANPTFLWDDVMLKEGRKGPKQFLLPPGPNNPVGILWLEIEPLSGPEAHIGIHGTNDPARIGRNHSSGCIRLANWDIVRLARLVGKGTLLAWSGVSTPEATIASAR